MRQTFTQTVYRYFPNARELVRATLLRGGRNLLEEQILVFQGEGDPQAMIRSILDPALIDRGVEGLAPIARQLGWTEQDRREAFDLIARTVVSCLTMPPPTGSTDGAVRDVLRRRLLPALGVSA